MKGIFKDIKSMKKLASNKDFYFIITVYPLGTALLFYLYKKLMSSGLMTDDVKEMYSLISIGVIICFVAYTIYEIIDTNLLYKNQGDKLKLKQGEKDWQNKRSK